MTKQVDQIDGDTLAMLKKIDDHDSIYEAEVNSAHGTFRLEFNEVAETSRWTLDITQLVREGGGKVNLERENING